MAWNSLLNSERYLFLSRSRLVADDADSCGLAIVLYDTCNWQNAGKNTPFQIAAQPNFDPIPKVNCVFISKVMEE